MGLQESIQAILDDIGKRTPADDFVVDLSEAEFVELMAEQRKLQARVAELEAKLRCDFCGKEVLTRCSGHCDNDE